MSYRAYLYGRDVLSVRNIGINLRVSSIARRLPWGSDWEQIMLGVRFIINPGWVSALDTDTNMNFGTATTIPRWEFGVSANEGVVYNGGIDHFVGMVSNANTWNNSAVSESDRGYAYGSSGQQIQTHIGHTYTNYAGSISSGSAGLNAVVGNSTALFVQITKGSPNWAIKYAHPNAYSNGEDISFGKMRVMCETDIESVTTWDSSYQRSNTAAAPPIDEATYGDLDSVCVSWNFHDPGMEIYDIYVHRRY